MSPDLTWEQQMVFLRVLAAGVVLVALIDFTLIVAYALRRQRTLTAYGPPTFASRWSLVDVWIAAHVFVAGMIPVAIGVVIILMIAFGSSTNLVNPKGPGLIAALILGMIGQTALMIGIPVFFITQKYRISLPRIGFRWPPSGAEIRKGMLFGLGMMLLSAGLQIALMAALNRTVGPEGTQELKDVTSKIVAERLLKDNAGPAMLITLLLVAGVMAPLSEELFFRGFLYNAAKHRLGIVPGIILSALVFALVHIGPLAVIGIIPMGVLLALAYEKSGSLWVPIMMHATNNILAVTLTYLMPDLGI